MYEIIELTLHTNKLGLFGFLKHNPTKVLKNGDFYKFLYFAPLGRELIAFSYTDIIVKTITGDPSKSDTQKGWILVRDKKIALASADLWEILQDLEATRLAENRQGTWIELKGEILDIVSQGIYTRREVAYFIRLLFLHGYDFDTVLELFTNLIKRADLAGFFLDTITSIYKGEKIG